MNSFITQSKQMPAIGLAVALLVLCLLAACKPKVEPVACTPLPIVDGFETAMTEGGKMRLRVPKHTSWLTADCKQIKGVELRYYWHKGELVWNDGTQSTLEFSKQTLEHPVIIYLTSFQFLHEVQHNFRNDTSLFAFKPCGLRAHCGTTNIPWSFIRRATGLSPIKHQLKHHLTRDGVYLAPAIQFRMLLSMPRAA